MIKDLTLQRDDCLKCDSRLFTPRQFHYLLAESEYFGMCACANERLVGIGMNTLYVADDSLCVYSFANGRRNTQYVHYNHIGH